MWRIQRITWSSHLDHEDYNKEAGELRNDALDKLDDDTAEEDWAIDWVSGYVDIDTKIDKNINSRELKNDLGLND